MRWMYGIKGVTSKGIFSRAWSSGTGLVLLSSMAFVQGSTLTRPPSGSAAICSVRLICNSGALCISAAMRTCLPSNIGLPKRGVSRFGISPARRSSAFRKSPAPLSLSL